MAFRRDPIMQQATSESGANFRHGNTLRLQRGIDAWNRWLSLKPEGMTMQKYVQSNRTGGEQALRLLMPEGRIGAYLNEIETRDPTAGEVAMRSLNQETWNRMNEQGIGQGEWASGDYALLGTTEDGRIIAQSGEMTPEQAGMVYDEYNRLNPQTVDPAMRRPEDIEFKDFRYYADGKSSVPGMEAYDAATGGADAHHMAAVGESEGIVNAYAMGQPGVAEMIASLNAQYPNPAAPLAPEQVPAFADGKNPYTREAALEVLPEQNAAIRQPLTEADEQLARAFANPSQVGYSNTQARTILGVNPEAPDYAKKLPALQELDRVYESGQRPTREYLVDLARRHNLDSALVDQRSRNMGTVAQEMIHNKLMTQGADAAVAGGRAARIWQRAKQLGEGLAGNPALKKVALGAGAALGPIARAMANVPGGVDDFLIGTPAGAPGGLSGGEMPGMQFYDVPQDVRESNLYDPNFPMTFGADPLQAQQRQFAAEEAAREAQRNQENQMATDRLNQTIMSATQAFAPVGFQVPSRAQGYPVMADGQNDYRLARLTEEEFGLFVDMRKAGVEAEEAFARLDAHRAAQPDPHVPGRDPGRVGPEVGGQNFAGTLPQDQTPPVVMPPVDPAVQAEEALAAQGYSTYGASPNYVGGGGGATVIPETSTVPSQGPSNPGNASGRPYAQTPAEAGITESRTTANAGQPVIPYTPGEQPASQGHDGSFDTQPVGPPVPQEEVPTETPAETSSEGGALEGSNPQQDMTPEDKKDLDKVVSHFGLIPALEQGYANIAKMAPGMAQAMGLDNFVKLYNTEVANQLDPELQLEFLKLQQKILEEDRRFELDTMKAEDESVYRAGMLQNGALQLLVSEQDSLRDANTAQVKQRYEELKYLADPLIDLQMDALLNGAEINPNAVRVLGERFGPEHGVELTYVKKPGRGVPFVSLWRGNRDIETMDQATYDASNFRTRNSYMPVITINGKAITGFDTSSQEFMTSDLTTFFSQFGDSTQFTEDN